MIKLECDRCKKDAGLCAYDITIQVLHNPTPSTYYCDDVGRAEITHDRTVKRFLLCSECLKKLGLPNPYADGIIFRDEGSEEE